MHVLGVERAEKEPGTSADDRGEDALWQQRSRALDAPLNAKKIAEVRYCYLHRKLLVSSCASRHKSMYGYYWMDVYYLAYALRTLARAGAHTQDIVELSPTPPALSVAQEIEHGGGDVGVLARAGQGGGGGEEKDAQVKKFWRSIWTFDI